jgi:hypothetical protein
MLRVFAYDGAKGGCDTRMTDNPASCRTQAAQEPHIITGRPERDARGPDHMARHGRIARRRPSVVVLVALSLLLAVAAGACTGGGDGGGSSTPPERREVQSYGGPPVKGAANPIGLKWDWPNLERYLPFVKDLAGGATFYVFEWCRVEPRPGQHDWSTVDEVVRSSQRLGYGMLLKIRVGSCWITGGRRGDERGDKRTTASAMPEDLGAYQAFVRTVVERYRPMGVREYGIENEVNARNFWAGTPQEYEQLLRLGAQAVHAADPQAQIHDSGIASPIYGTAIAARLLEQGRDAEAVAAYQRYYTRRGSQYRPVRTVEDLRPVLQRTLVRRGLEYLAATQRLAREQVFDVYQLHFYEPWDNVPALLDYLRQTLPSGLPVEASEVGMFWRGGPDQQRNDQRLRASEAVKVVSLLLAGGVRRVTWLPTGAHDEGDDEGELHFGLLNGNGDVRPAGQAVRRLAASAAGTTWTGVASGPARGVAFGKGHKTTLVIWSDRGATLPGAALSGAAVSTPSGTPVQWGAGGLRLGPEPVLVGVPLPLEEATRLVG